MNFIVLTGRLTRDVELRYITNGKPVADFTIAVTRPYKNSEGIYETDFINCEIWGKTAETMKQYTNKGDLIGIEGRLRVDKYQDKDGNNKTRTYAMGEKITFLSTKKQDSKEERINNGLPEDNLEMPF